MNTRIEVSAKWLGVSVVVLGGIFALVFGYWYPPPYFRIEGADRVFYVMVAAQLVLGPLLMLILFKPGKKGLWIDMTVISILQVAALYWGLSILYRDRPLFMVYAVDRFNVLAARDIDPMAVRSAGFLERKPGRGPLPLVAVMPTDPGQREELLMATLFRGEDDIERRPEYWSDYSERLPEVLASASTLEQLVGLNPELTAAIERSLQQHDLGRGQVLFAPVRGVHGDFAVMLNRENGVILGAFEIATWF
jgi:hypothetical protein